MMALSWSDFEKPDRKGKSLMLKNETGVSISIANELNFHQAVVTYRKVTRPFIGHVGLWNEKTFYVFGLWEAEWSESCLETFKVCKKSSHEHQYWLSTSNFKE
jgi:hypothetical protein